MLKIGFLVSTILLHMSYASIPLDIDCNYYTTKFNILGKIYHCEVTNVLNITSPLDATITSMNGSHELDKTNNDVIGFKVDGKGTEYFPQYLQEFFPNLKLIMIENGRIKEIHQSDLKPFPELVSLDLWENDIEVLDEGLFDFNPKLAGFWIFHNKIFHVDYQVFDNLSKLIYIDMFMNVCIDKMGSYSKSAVQQVVDYAKMYCQDKEYMRITGELSALEHEVTVLSTKIQRFLNDNMRLARSVSIVERLNKLRKYVQE
ncbi:hypothetical protein ACKWTF_006264 [Chironomus riparius]